MAPTEPSKPPVIGGSNGAERYSAVLTELLAARVGRSAKPLECLDMVCREGSTTLGLLPTLPPGSRVVSVGTNRDELTKFHSTIRPEQEAAIFPRKEAAGRYPFGREAFDVVFANLAMQGPPDDPKGFIRQASRFIKPPGQLIFVVLLRDTVVELLRAVGARLDGSQEGTALREWMGNSSTLQTADEWQDLMKKSNFTDFGVDRLEVKLELTPPLTTNEFMTKTLMPSIFGEQAHNLEERLRHLDDAASDSFSCSLFAGCIYGRRSKIAGAPP